MKTDGRSSNDLIDGLVRTCFGMEPGAMAALARGDEETRLRRLPDTADTTDPLDGLELLMRRIVSLCVALRGHPGAVALLTERQAAAAGWPSARLANLCVVLAWALAVTEPAMALPLLVEADEDAGSVMVQLIRVDARLPDFDHLLDRLNKSARIDCDAMDRAAAAREHAAALENVRIVALDRWLADWIGIDVHGIELPFDRRDAPPKGRNARAIGLLGWLATTALHLGSAMAFDGIEAVRLKTEQDARLAGEPCATLANLALLLGAAIRHGGGYTVHVLPQDGKFAEALVEAGSRIRREGAYRNGDAQTQSVIMFDLMDLAARGYVHPGRQAVRQVAWRLVRDEA